MLTIGFYLIKSCVYLLAFYIPFILVLKRTTFFTINRFYLMSGLLLSFILPLYTGLIKIPTYVPPELPLVEPLFTHTESVITRASETTGSLTMVAFLVIIYTVGIAVRLIQLNVSIARIFKLKREGDVSLYRSIKIVKTNTAVPFSFFNFVFLPTALNDPGILEHETAHVQQYHWIDLLFVELVSVILWFNPMMIFYKRSLKQQHEYLADRSAINNKVDLAEYLTSIRKQIELAVPSILISEFYFQSIKNRINMLTKERTSLFGLTTYTIVLPLILFLLMAFSSRKDFQIETQGEIGFIQDPLSLGLPIGKEDEFVLESGYGERMHPVLGVKRLHTGIDLIANEGVPVIAAEDGVVVKAHMADAWGNIIVVRHEGTYSTSYSHLKSMNVRVGTSVMKGQVIGLVGNTGLSTKYHLHFELLDNNKAIDPIAFLPKIK
jgi:murein DD-endopeptidase MepM/ murein hydrolase activator NlpD